MRNILFGSSVKTTVNPWNLDSDIGWLSSSNLGDMAGLDVYFRRVPWFRRGVKDRALNVASLPWSVMFGDEEIATSAEWSDDKPTDLDWLDNPRKLFGQLEQSLAVMGRAYIALECNQYGYIKAARYCAPNTITEIYEPATGKIAYYERHVNAVTLRCDPAWAKFQPGVVRIVCIYDADYLTEEYHPANSSDGLAALSAAGVLFSTDKFIEQFFSRGAIKASILTVDGGSQAEVDRLQAWWDDVISGVKNAWAALVMRGKLAAPVVIGQGTEGLENDALSTAKRQDVATALGVPESRLWSAAANYATREMDEKAYFRGTIIPEFDLIAEALNSQVFTEAHNLEGFRIESQPETLDVFQADEANRAGSLAQLVGAGVPLVTAMQILGYDLTDEQWEALEPEEPKLAPMLPTAPLAQPAPVETEPILDETEPPMMSAETIKEMDIWQRKAIKALKATGCASVNFAAGHIGQADYLTIETGLAAAKTVEQIKAVFEAAQRVTDDPWLAAAERLSAALERLAE